MFLTSLTSSEALSDLAQKEQEKRRILGELADSYDLSDDELGFDNSFVSQTIFLLPFPD